MSNVTVRVSIGGNVNEYKILRDDENPQRQLLRLDGPYREWSPPRSHTANLLKVKYSNGKKKHD